MESYYNIHGMVWKFYGRGTPEHIGYIPEFLHEKDPRPAREQIHENYAHGGGWFPFEGMEFMDGALPELQYPIEGSHERFPAWAETTLHGKERVIVFMSAWVAIVPVDDGSGYEVARVD
jgi:hypothetical protein